MNMSLLSEMTLYLIEVNKKLRNQNIQIQLQNQGNTIPQKQKKIIWYKEQHQIKPNQEIYFIFFNGIIKRTLVKRAVFTPTGTVNFWYKLNNWKSSSTTEKAKLFACRLQPYRRLGGPWQNKSRDTSVAFLDIDYGIYEFWFFSLSSDKNLGIGVTNPVHKIKK